MSPCLEQSVAAAAVERGGERGARCCDRRRRRSGRWKRGRIAFSALPAAHQLVADHRHPFAGCASTASVPGDLVGGGAVDAGEAAAPAARCAPPHRPCRAAARRRRSGPSRRPWRAMSSRGSGWPVRRWSSPPRIGRCGGRLRPAAASASSAKGSRSLPRQTKPSCVSSDSQSAFQRAAAAMLSRAPRAARRPRATAPRRRGPRSSRR